MKMNEQFEQNEKDNFLSNFLFQPTGFAKHYPKEIKLDGIDFQFCQLENLPYTFRNYSDINRNCSFFDPR